MKIKQLLSELNATFSRYGSSWIISHIDGCPLSRPKIYKTKREALADLSDWWENGWEG